ncbi:MAG: ATP-dependent zinc metalloprotease FtsH [candidate division KSB1 bacterium]|nr:ATP-dependent zinc metalloprotease FtsH [candidate division KSB1 bacterium]
MQRARHSKQGSNPGPNRRVTFSIWYLLLAIFLVYLVESLFMRPQVDKIPYSRFKEMLRRGLIVNCAVSPQNISGLYLRDDPGVLSGVQFDTVRVVRATLLDSVKILRARLDSATVSALIRQDKVRRFSTVRVEDPDLVWQLEAAGIQYTGKSDGGWFRSLFLGGILPLLFLFVLWGFIFRRMGPSGGLMSIGKSRAKVYVEGNTRVTFKDVAGIDEAVEEVKEIVEFLKNPQKFKELGGRIPKGVLLVGPPGTGKTLLARAVAGEAGVPFFSLTGSDFVEMFVGVGAARVRDLFQQAAQKAPCIIFIDELDALGKARALTPLPGGHDEREQTLNQLLAEMDGFDPNIGIIVMAATNRPEILDLALLRPGRFDRQIVVDRPDLKGREAILRVHARNVKLAPNVDLRVVAARTPGFVGADLANVVNEAALLAARKGKKQVEMEDFEEAIDRVIAGLERKSRVMNPREKERVAYHEAGHAVVACSLQGVDPVHRVSIIPRGVAALGYTLQLPTEDRYLMTRGELENRLKVFLGGRVAEEIIFGEVSTGAQNDLERATQIARSMVAEYGMSERVGPVSYGDSRRGLFLGAEMPVTRPYSEQVAAEIDAEVRRIIDDAYSEVRQLLLEKREKLENLARRLLQKEVVEREELAEILGPDGTGCSLAETSAQENSSDREPAPKGEGVHPQGTPTSDQT